MGRQALSPCQIPGWNPPGGIERQVDAVVGLAALKPISAHLNALREALAGRDAALWNVTSAGPGLATTSHVTITPGTGRLGDLSLLRQILG